MEDFPAFDVAVPVGAAAGVSDGEAFFTGGGFWCGEDGGDGDGVAVGDEGGALGGGDADAGAAVAAGAATDEDGVEGLGGVLCEELGEWLEEEGVVAAVAKEGGFLDEFSVYDDGDGGGLGGGFYDEEGGHSGCLGWGWGDFKE